MKEGECSAFFGSDRRDQFFRDDFRRRLFSPFIFVFDIERRRRFEFDRERRRRRRFY
jgi:hypothetical protein